MCEGEKKRTESEALFEEYLKSNGYEDPEYEPCIPDCRKRPDYLLRWHGQELFFEVKELRQKGAPPTCVTPIDPYDSLRSEIHEAKAKFRKFKKWCCSLVVWNAGDWKARLDPLRVFGAMLGNLRVEFEPDGTRGALRPETAKLAFGEGGKMVHPKTAKRQNTTIAAIIVLERFSPWVRLHNLALEREHRRRQAELGRPLDLREILELPAEVQECCAAGHQAVPSVVVHDNPFARIRLPEHIFQGPYDERWAWDGQHLQCSFCGERLREQLTAEQYKCDEPEAPC